MKKYRRLSNTLIFMLSKSYKVITFANSNVINASSSNQFDNVIYLYDIDFIN